MATTERFGRQDVRRWSSLDPSRADLYGGPSVAVPPKHLMASSESEAHEITVDMESAAKHHLDEEFSSDEGIPTTPAIASPVYSPHACPTDDFALAFDIDGVLVKGGQPIPGAVEAMKYINGENPYGLKVYVFLFLSSIGMTC